MKKLLRRAIALLLIFVLAISAYVYIGSQGKKTPERVFSGLEEVTMPGIWIHALGRQMNRMYPYVTTPGINITYDTLTVLPSDRKLKLHIDPTDLSIKQISYEIRSQDLSDLVEKTELPLDAMQDLDHTLILPIQNLLKANQEYRLDLSITYSNEKTAHYYSKIMLGNQALATAMVDLASSFSEKNFDYNTARENTTYLESDSTGDNSSLANVNLKSSYDMLTYNRLQLALVGEKDIRLTGFDGKMGEITLSFTVKRDLEDGKAEYYEIFESFTLRQGPERLYMMDYSRTMSELFTGMTDPRHSNKIVLGINAEKNISATSSKSLQFEAFVSNRDLFLVDSKASKLKKVFSFRSEDDLGLPRKKYDVKILRVEDNGDIEFMIYGHIVRGQHEGELGISLNRFDYAQNAIIERSFIPISTGFEEIRQGVNELAHLGENHIFYVKIADSVYGFDIHTNDYILVASDIKDYQMGVSELGKGLAWQGATDENGSEVLYYLDLESGEKKQINAPIHELLRIEGFVGEDMIVSVVERNGVWMNNGKAMPTPTKSIRIIDSALNIVKEYEKPSHYLNHIYVVEDRVHMDLLTKSEEGAFATVGKDTIVSTTTKSNENRDVLSTLNSDEKKKMYYLQGVSMQNVDDMEAWNRISYEQSATINVQVVQKQSKYMAIGQGDLKGGFDQLYRAIDVAYNNMGSVRQNGKLIYLRADTSSARNLKISDYDIAGMLAARERDELLVLRGITLRQALYYVSNYMPVLTYSDAGTPIVIYAYDRTHITVYDTGSGESVRLDIQDAISMFDKSYNDFSTFFTFP